MDTCKKNEFSDGPITGDNDDIELREALVLQRDGDDDHGVCRTNVPHLVVHHSPDGFEWGYGGSGPADLALNICQYYLNSIGYQGMKTDCFDGFCWSLAWVLHQQFKWDFISSAPHEGVTIQMSEIKAWFDVHITEDMKRMYSDIDEPVLDSNLQ